MSAYDELRLIGASLYDGETRAGGVCPFCHGGRTGEGSLSVTKLQTGATLFFCHRAACGKRGRIGESWTAVDGPADSRKPKAEFEPRLYDNRGDVDVRAYDAVGNDYYQSPQGWLSRFGIDPAEAPCRWNPGNQRTVWEVRSALGTLRGYELRAYRDDHKPKTLHYRHSSEPWVGHCNPSGTPRGDGGPASPLRLIVAVEDVVSAYKVSMAGFRACSLMGTNLNLDKLMDLLGVSEHIVLALDRDATEKAVGFAKRFSLLAPDLVVMPLERDLKYEDTETITKMIGALL